MTTPSTAFTILYSSSPKHLMLQTLQLPTVPLNQIQIKSFQIIWYIIGFTIHTYNLLAILKTGLNFRCSMRKSVMKDGMLLVLI